MWKSVNWAKHVHWSAEGENFKCLDFSKSFRKWRKSIYFDIRKTQIQSSVIWMKNVKKCELSKICPQVRCGRKPIYLILLKVFENEENHHIFMSGQLKYKNWRNWLKNVKKCELSKKMSTGSRWAKILIFFYFWKIFENEENHPIWTSRQLKYKKSLTWMKMWKSVNRAKKLHRIELGENFNLFNFLKSLQKWRKSSYLDIRTTKI